MQNLIKKLIGLAKQANHSITDAYDGDIVSFKALKDFLSIAYHVKIDGITCSEVALPNEDKLLMYCVTDADSMFEDQIHPDCWEILSCIKGYMYDYISENAINEGEYIVIPPGERHRIFVAKNTQCTVYFSKNKPDNTKDTVSLSNNNHNKPIFKDISA